MSKISLCAIVRNEAELLPRMLASVQDVVAEMVIVDTGSTDETVAIARSHGATVLHHAFSDDFSAARNVALRAATRPWILVLDADEWLAQGTGAILRQAVCRPRRAGFYLRFENDLGGGRSHVCAMLRLFRNDAAIRFRYLIHEQVLPDLLGYCRRKRRRLEVLPKAVVHHDGYLPAHYQSRQKDQRNERLFRLQVERYPDHVYSWYKFGDFLRRFPDRRPEAMTALARAAELLRRMDQQQARELSFPAEVFALLAVEMDKAGRTQDALEAAHEGLGRFGATPNLLYVLGHLLARCERHRLAFRAYAKLRALDGKLMPVPPEPGVTGPIALFGMGRALANLGHPHAARRCLEQSIALNPVQTDAHLMLARLHLEAGRTAAAVQHYRAALEHDPTDVAVRIRLGTVLLHTDDAAEAERQFRLAREQGADPDLVAPRLAEALLARGDLQGAYLAFAERPDAPSAGAGMRLLQLLAAGADPAAEPDLQGADARRWLRHLARNGVMPLGG